MRPVRRVLLALRGHKVTPDRKALKVPPVHRVLPARKVRRATRGPPDRRAPRAM